MESGYGMVETGQVIFKQVVAASFVFRMAFKATRDSWKGPVQARDSSGLLGNSLMAVHTKR